MEWISYESCFFGTVGFQIPICRYSQCGIINSYTNAIGRDNAISITYSFGFLRRRITAALSSSVYQQTYAGKTKGKRSRPRSSEIGFRIFSKNDLIFNLSFFDRFHGLWPQVCKKTGECQSSDGSGMEAMPPGRSVLFPETEMAVSRQAAASSSRRESRERERRRSWLKKVPKKMSPAPVVSTG